MDWGLGHTTRCIPLIAYLQQFQCRIFIASTNKQRKLLENEFDSLNYLQIEGYDIRYRANSNNLGISILKQIPRLYGVIGREQQWLNRQMAENQFDLIISDNRYGLFHKNAHCIFITHQLTVISGIGVWADGLLRKIHWHFINKFHECWIPDNRNLPNLSGVLGHPPQVREKISYIGPLSRFRQLTVNKQLELLVLLSGPEPHRTLFETLMLKQLTSFQGRYLLVRGLPDEQPSSHPHTVNHLHAADLNRAICSASMVIARSGYTSIMDLVASKQKAILVATPGQTEQEYLVAYMQEQGIFLSAQQDGFNLSETLQKAERFESRIPDLDFEQYKTVLAERLSNTQP